MEKLIGWLVVGIFYAIFTSMGKKKKQQELQKKITSKESETVKPATQVPTEATKPVGDIFKELMKQFEVRENPIPKKKLSPSQPKNNRQKTNRKRLNLLKRKSKLTRY